jgi:hypothetical protein
MIVFHNHNMVNAVWTKLEIEHRSHWEMTTIMPHQCPSTHLDSSVSDIRKRNIYPNPINLVSENTGNESNDDSGRGLQIGRRIGNRVCSMKPGDGSRARSRIESD